MKSEEVYDKIIKLAKEMRKHDPELCIESITITDEQRMLLHDLTKPNNKAKKDLKKLGVYL